MAENKFEMYEEIFRNNNNILRQASAIKLGIPEYLIYEMFDKGLLIRESRGLYRLADSEPLANPDIVQVSLLIPKSVIFLLSALYFYGYTTQIPRQVYIALPQEIKKPRLKYPPIKVFYRDKTQYSSGIEEHKTDGVAVRVYTREKTITDCFKFRNQIGKEIAVEALKDYMGETNPKIDKLMRYAKINRVENLIRPYIESLA